MKAFFKTVLKGLLVIILFTGGTLILSTNGVETVNEAKAASYNEVDNYLVAHGYEVITLVQKKGTNYDWTAQTIKDGIRYITTIYCTETSIIGTTDIPM